MEKHRTCKYCKQIFENIEGRIFANHVRWCVDNPKRQNTENISKSLKKFNENRYGKLKKFCVNCFKCDKEFEVEEKEKKFPQKEKYFCERSCANNRGTMSEKTKEKVRSKLIKPRKAKICEFCKQEHYLNRMFCSDECLKNFRNINRTEKRIYQIACSFNFKVYDFPEYFEMSLVEKLGWYHPTKNPEGVSRDHKISVSFGWKNKIDPKIISHPCNCEIMIFKDNQMKQTNCSLKIEQLEKDIGEWDCTGWSPHLQ